MKHFYYLATCSTCKKIIQKLSIEKHLSLQDIKTEKITAEQIDQMAEIAGSYEALFSRRARKYQAMNLKEKDLSESDIRELILEEYTFLKRPVAIIDNEIFIGNSSKNIEALEKALTD